MLQLATPPQAWWDCTNGMKTKLELGEDAYCNMNAALHHSVVTPTRPYASRFLHVQRVLFDELPALLDVFAHQRGDDLVGLDAPPEPRRPTPD